MCARRDTRVGPLGLRRLAGLLGLATFALAACADAEQNPEYAGVPAWCEPTREWADTQRALELELVGELNLARERPHDCGQVTMPAAGPMLMAPRLHCAARMHALDVGQSGNLAHEGSDGLGTAARLGSATYGWFAYAELLDDEDDDAVLLVQRWLNDPPACRDLMGAAAVEVGVGYANGAWVALLATPSG